MEPIAIEPLKFKDIQIAVLEQKLAEQQGRTLIAEAQQQAQALGVAGQRRLRKAMEAAGLDPDATYQIDAEAFTVTLSEAKSVP
jgi:hypothetical protein